ncbi:hypothetical protein RHOFW510R12_03485 [Rhodanobacter sp. FW510-R12]|uniref:hypothetical protein n=1 Tax=unclassified Rhodanobacter TaxID=2621553 RepID=UPI0007AA3814|nr:MULTISPECIES: hypothetical protein [unclassified Rhodanobacter]KZC17920.1 hypothetical protein RHOFW104R8_08465 [Rhodanobacter sp. FW104-R8]KZC25619.1 hypothetical protein RhoFW510T8_06825 [Rhodanobacter sp. FW510-T8]KZC32821.1 hypothetical protein RhoFW510R10_10905 [Rhodanobacter sp. FW510-R10]
MAERSATAERKSPAGQATPAGVLRRKCACGAHVPGGGECESCKKKHAGLRRSAQTSNPPAALRTADPLTASLMRSRFGEDFSRIRVNGANVPMARANDGGREMDIDVRTVRHNAPARLGALQQAGERTKENEGAGAGGIMRTAQIIPPPPGVTGPVRSGSGSGGCSFAIDYENVRNTGCGASCGAQIEYDVTGVTATGSGCPPTLNGLRVTESVTTDNGCGPGGVTTGAGCPIEEHPPLLPGHGIIRNCHDTYALCGPATAFGATGCTETYTQKLFVGGALAETRAIRFVITRSGSSCSGTVTRT